MSNCESDEQLQKRGRQQMSNQDNKQTMVGEADVSYGLQCFQQKKFEEGFQAFMKAALKGHPGAMNNIAYCFYNGQGTAVDKEASFMWMKKAAEAGFTPAYFALAVKYLKGDGVAASVRDAVLWAQRANKEGNVHQEKAQQMLAQIDENIRKSPVVQQARQAAMKDVVKGMELMKENKHKEAFNCFMNASMMGDPNAMYNASLCFSSGQGTQKDDRKAFIWMKKAAEFGLPVAFCALAEKYLNGRGTERSLELAEIWAKRGAETPNPFADNAKAILEIIRHENSYAPEIREALSKGNEFWSKGEYKEALAQLEIAGRGGHAAALRLIGYAYLKGLGVAANASYAYQFLEASAYRGDRLAVSLIAQSFAGVNKVALWQYYAQAHKLENSDRVWEAHLMQEQKIKRGNCTALNAQQAMEQAAAYWKAGKENPEAMAQNPHAGALMARSGFEKAMYYGNLDGVCGLAEMFKEIGNPEHLRVVNDMYQIAAYLGHSYAMFGLGKYYEEINKEIADACYLQAARWEYQPAVEICKERGIN